MARKKKILNATFEETSDWLAKLVATAPRPLPAGRFPRLLQESQTEGYNRDMLLDVLDLWLNYGYCRLIDPIASDIELTPEGETYFYK